MGIKEDIPRVDVKLLKEWREYRGYSRRWVADKAGISLKMLCEIEAGTANPSFQTVHRLCRLVKINFIYLYREVYDSVFPPR